MQKYNPLQFTALTRYLKILINEYPKPLRASILAAKAKTSKAAVTKVKPRLTLLCARTPNRLKRTLILKTDADTFITLALIFLAAGEHRVFFHSKYFKRCAQKLSENIAQAPIFLRHLTGADVKTLITLIVAILLTADRNKIRKTFKQLLTQPSQLGVIDLYNTLRVSIERAKLNKDVIGMRDDILSLEDKLRRLTDTIIEPLAERSELFKALGEEDRANYLKVYRSTATFYLEKFFYNVNTKLWPERGEEPVYNALQNNI
ncbi:MAG TPA: hypothetical protein VKV31_01860 [bacterium]|nr:hypothetical protein [bacterium]